MDDNTSSIKLPIHKHPLFSSARFHDRCDGCSNTQQGEYYGGYRCNDSDCNLVFFHKKCAESPSEINHPSHPEHPLKLTENPPRSMCDLCGNNIFVTAPYFYHCSICDFNVDTSCARKPPLPLSVAHPNPQELPFVFIKESQSEFDRCGVCEQTVFGAFHYGRPSCDEYVHVECINLAEKVKLLPFHPSHPLELTKSASLSEKVCILCGVSLERVLYYCSTCDFSMCLGCVITPPPLVIEHSRTHEHHLTLSLRQISFTCNVCGMHDEGSSSYSCLPCGFMVHRSCIDLPQVVIINRHDHRLSRTNHLGQGYSDCGVCRRPLNQIHGAYSCSICPKYAVHSQCATSIEVWDGIDLEGIEEIEVLPFKAVGDNMINHFSHEEHDLRLNSENVTYDETTRCEACVYPLNGSSDPIYSCEECDYFLHEKCANLPMKRRHLSYNKPFALHARGEDPEDDWFVCRVCQKQSTGFRYMSDFFTLDVHCSSVSEPFVHDGHLHPLYYEHEASIRECDSCHNRVDYHVLKCDVCEFSLDFSCATLPKA